VALVVAVAELVVVAVVKLWWRWSSWSRWWCWSSWSRCRRARGGRGGGGPGGRRARGRGAGVLVAVVVLVAAVPSSPRWWCWSPIAAVAMRVAELVVVAVGRRPQLAPVAVLVAALAPLDLDVLPDVAAPLRMWCTQVYARRWMAKTVVYETKSLGIVVRVYSDRLEYTPGFLSSPQSIPIAQIASIKQATWTNRLIIETSGGREYTIVTSKKREVEDAIYQAQAMMRAPAGSQDVQPHRAALPMATPAPSPSPSPSPSGSGSLLRRVLLVGAGLVVVLIIVGAVSGPSEDEPSSKPACDGREGARRAWIQASSPEMEGYSPFTFNMRSTGACDDDLRVREDDCSIPHLIEAYGVKPFMKTAVRLGFQTLSCGYDEYDLSAIVGR
jgi:hypothetical protein